MENMKCRCDDADELLAITCEGRYPGSEDKEIAQGALQISRDADIIVGLKWILISEET